jgi:hypothetical protein
LKGIHAAAVLAIPTLAARILLFHPKPGWLDKLTFLASSGVVANRRLKNVVGLGNWQAHGLLNRCFTLYIPFWQTCIVTATCTVLTVFSQPLPIPSKITSASANAHDRIKHVPANPRLTSTIYAHAYVEFARTICGRRHSNVVQMFVMKGGGAMSFQECLSSSGSLGPGGLCCQRKQEWDSRRKRRSTIQRA